jgi:hypothetical protein
LRKIAIILFLGIVASGCSVTRKSGSKHAAFPELIETKNDLENVTKQNITSAGFFIQKAEIELSNQNGKQKFIATVKFAYPDKYLISLKSRTGIEGVRIYISKDSLIGNDRINKKMYFVSVFYLKQKFGLTQSLLPLIFGDLIKGEKQQEPEEKCVGGSLEFKTLFKGVNLSYNIDCWKSKTSIVDVSNFYLEQSVKLRSIGYMNTGVITIPKVIEIEDLSQYSKIRIKFVKIEYPWNGNVKFIPGRGYEIIELL